MTKRYVAVFTEGAMGLNVTEDIGVYEEHHFTETVAPRILKELNQYLDSEFEDTYDSLEEAIEAEEFTVEYVTNVEESE